MKIVTEYVHPDEPSWGLYEGPRNVPRKGRRWVQAVYVLRDDAIAEHLTDIGSADLFERIQPMILPSPDGCNTVAQLQEFAEKNRHDEYWADRVDEMLSESTLVEDHLRQLEQHRAIVANRSTFGPSGGHQRNGYARQAARERYANRN